MKTVLIIAHFAELKEESDNCRFMYLVNMLKDENVSTKLLLSSFSHTKKEQRNNNIIDKNISMIYEPGYKKNVSIKRLYSHRIMANNLKKYLSATEKPDVIYCAVPSLDVAKVAAKFCKKNNVKFIIDIQDIWPEAFELVFNIPLLSKVIFWPLKTKADYIYTQADSIVAVSNTYKARAEKVNKTGRNNISVFLGTELKRFDEIEALCELGKEEGDIWIAYVGTLGHSYDLKIVMDAMKLLLESASFSIKLIVMGDGPLEDDFKKYSEKLGVDARFLGRLPYEQMVAILKKCDIAVNPISKGAAQSIINKVGDYAAAGLPVLNTQECQEYRDLVDEYECGFNCDNSNAKDLAEKMKVLITDKNISSKMGANNRSLAEDLFDRKKTYSKIVELIKSFC